MQASDAALLAPPLEARARASGTSTSINQHLPLRWPLARARMNPLTLTAHHNPTLSSRNSPPPMRGSFEPAIRHTLHIDCRL